jgi:tRNA-modifying protein YgfZ
MAVSDPSHTASTTLLFDRTARLRMQFSGSKAAESLTGLLTNDVLALKAGDGQYACALTPKGRVIADVRVFAVDDSATGERALLVDTNAAAGVGFAAMIRKYVNPRVTKYVDISAGTSCLTVAGPEALLLLESLATRDAPAGAAFPPGDAFAHRELQLGEHPARVLATPELGDLPAYDVLCARDAAAEIAAALVGAGATRASEAEWHRLRTIAGRPEWGVDMDESTLAQEANMDALHAISYTKGCYTGQETVARVHYRGHVNRTLRRISLTGDIAPSVGTVLLSGDAADVGGTRSIAVSANGPLVGIAMLRREVADGAALTWTDAAGLTQTVTVVGAPAS